MPSELVRAVPAITRDPLAHLAATVRRYGDLVAFPMPRTPVLLVNDPAGARRVLQDNHRGYSKATLQYGALSAVTGAGLLTADGVEWRRRRRVAQPAFHHGGLDAVAAGAVAAAQGMRDRWDAAPPGTPVDADAASMDATLDLIGRTLFAADLTDRHVAAGIVHAVDVALRAVVGRARSPLGMGPLARIPTPSSRRQRAAVAVLDDACAELVRRRRAAGVRRTDTDVLAVLLRAADEHGGLTDTELRDEVVTLVIAGHETVAAGLTWTLHLLAGSPQVQAALHAELDQVLAGRDPKWADLAALRYTRAVVDEALRLYPPAWVVTRRAVAPDVVAGVELPAGTLVLISPWLLHRRAESWPDPERFDPDRFLAGGAVASGPAAAAAGYLPFGAGPRLCIGRDVALVESVLMLATLLRDRVVTRPPGVQAPRVDALVTLRPRGGLPLLLGRR